MLEADNIDHHSQSNLEDFRIEHFDLEWTVDMEKRQLKGRIAHRVRVVKSEVKTLTFDTSKLEVTAATIDGQGAVYELGETHAVFGTALHVRRKDGASIGSEGDEVRVCIEYSTSASSSGIQWLEASQTEGKKHGYVFTQFQAIHARSALPCQDSPGVKQTYKARVTAPKPLTALMSALRRGQEEVNGGVAYAFEQPVAIPSYLVALAVGELVSQRVGPRSHVWCEPCRVAEAAWEFEQTEEFLRTAEEILTPYEFDQYDLLCLPGSFPYGGMENPCLTFVTPTLLAGDRSLGDVVAHEITHSWTGNLVTNRTWQHFWLNEGFTVFVERKIIQRLYGEPMRHFGYVVHNKDLKDSVSRYGQEHAGFTCLVQNQQGVDPDDAFSSVPYERGSQFLFYLETVVGKPDFEAFLKAYINRFRLSTLNSAEFKAFFLDHFASKRAAIDAKLDWDAWFYGTGMPPVDMLALFDDSLLKDSHALADRWAAAKDSDLAAFSADDLAGWSSKQTVAFLSHLLELTGESKPLSVPALDSMAAVYGFDLAKNSEIRFRWLMLNAHAARSASFENAISFLSVVGRMKFVRPLYRALYNQDSSKKLAQESFSKHRSFYHNICAKMVARDLDME